MQISENKWLSRGKKTCQVSAVEASVQVSTSTGPHDKQEGLPSFRLAKVLGGHFEEVTQYSILTSRYS